MGGRSIRTKHLLISIFMLTLIFLILLINNRVKTLLSIKSMDTFPLYYMNYHGGYKFDKYLIQGSKTYEELDSFIKHNITMQSTTEPKEMLSCSAFTFKNEDGDSFYGRNLDLSGDHPVAILCTKPPHGYASISMVELTVLGYYGMPGMKDSKLPQNIFSRLPMLAAPYMPRDGMNERGVAVATLDVPRNEGLNDPGKVTIGRWQANRLILDYAGNVEEAISLLEKYNCLDGGVHIFAADSTGKSAVIESINGKMVVTRNNESWQVVTNFIIADPLKEGKSKERYNIAYEELKANDGVLSEESGMNLLKGVSQDRTLWSVIYNLTNGDILLSLGRNYENIKSYKFNIR